MVKLENSVKRNFWQVGILAVLTFILLIVIGQLEQAAHMSEVMQIGVQEIVLIMIFAALNYLWVKQRVRVRAQVSFGHVLIISIPIILVVLYTMLISLNPHPASAYLMGAVAGIGAGIFEEYLFRGVILAKLLKSFPTFSKTKTIWYAVVISSIVFGIMHGSNFFVQSASATMTQILQAIFMGMLLAALYLRSGSILVPMLFHGIWDYSLTMLSGTAVQGTVGGGSPLSSLGLFVVIFAIAAFYLRPKKLKEINLDHFE